MYMVVRYTLVFLIADMAAQCLPYKAQWLSAESPLEVFSKMTFLGAI